MEERKIGSLAFLVGILIAILSGFMDVQNASTAATIVSILAILGLIVGFLNITVGEATPFLVATIALMIAGLGLSPIPYLGVFVSKVMTNIVVFVAPAAVVVSLMTIYLTASEK